MIERNGDVFDTTAPYLAHGANCVGVMGAGIARRIKKEYPNGFEEYRSLCQQYPAEQLVGEVLRTAPENDNPELLNLFTQRNPGPEAEYRYILRALTTVARNCKGPIAIPEIGCGIGGLEWPKVRTILEAIEIAYPNIEFEVWHYVGK